MPTSRRESITAHLRTLVDRTEVGGLLPTTEQLCDAFDVTGSQTIRNAYEPLIAEGLVEIAYRPRRRWVVRARSQANGQALVRARRAVGDAATGLTQAAAALTQAAAALDQAIAETTSATTNDPDGLTGRGAQ